MMLFPAGMKLWLSDMSLYRVTSFLIHSLIGGFGCFYLAMLNFPAVNSFKPVFM